MDEETTRNQVEIAQDSNGYGSSNSTKHSSNYENTLKQPCNHSGFPTKIHANIDEEEEKIKG